MLTLENISEAILIAFMSGICGFVWTRVLCKEGGMFHWFKRLVDKLPEWLSDPLANCHLCNAGQIALWVYLSLIILDGYPPILLTPVVCMAIYTARTVNV